MTFGLIADHIRQQRDAEVAHAELERLARRRRGSAPIGDLRLAIARALISLGQTVGGEALRSNRARRIPARPGPVTHLRGARG